MAETPHRTHPLTRTLPYLGLFCAALLMMTRIPELLGTVRFYWDDGKISFKYAYENNWISTLLAPHQGYYSFINNITALVQARWLPMESAPLLGTYVALFVQLLPHAVVWLGRSPYWATLPQKAMVSPAWMSQNSAAM
ncbi:MAG: hypothetical protein K2Q01_05560 [Rickettsiales bacterium]|nr:hypothetical protein [Rickettsiales bacterium]